MIAKFHFSPFGCNTQPAVACNSQTINRIQLGHTIVSRLAGWLASNFNLLQKFSCCWCWCCKSASNDSCLIYANFVSFSSVFELIAWLRPGKLAFQRRNQHRKGTRGSPFGGLVHADKLNRRAELSRRKKLASINSIRWSKKRLCCSGSLSQIGPSIGNWQSAIGGLDWFCHALQFTFAFTLASLEIGANLRSDFITLSNCNTSLCL